MLSSRTHLGTVLYIGGFELPDKNAAAQRVVGIGKSLSQIGYSVCFINSIRKGGKEPRKTEYFGFDVYEYQRENELDYLFGAKTILSKIKEIRPNIIFAYNYPAFALEKVRKYCKQNNIRCYADATEWYRAFGRNLIYRVVKNIDTNYRMRVVHKRLDGIISISRYLFEYYKDAVNTVIIPPIVDLGEEKWIPLDNKKCGPIEFVYAGVPSVQKEKLDLIVKAVESIPNRYSVVLNIVGVSKNEFISMYDWRVGLSERIKFWGRIEHKRVLEFVKRADWSIILRDNNIVVKAGFPTKLVESISCETPVIVNNFSNVIDYLDEKNSIVIEKFSDIDGAVLEALTKKTNVERRVFDYHQYLDVLKQLLVDEELVIERK